MALPSSLGQWLWCYVGKSPMQLNNANPSLFDQHRTHCALCWSQQNWRSPSNHDQREFLINASIFWQSQRALKHWWFQIPSTPTLLWITAWLLVVWRVLGVADWLFVSYFYKWHLFFQFTWILMCWKWMNQCRTPTLLKGFERKVPKLVSCLPACLMASSDRRALVPLRLEQIVIVQIPLKASQRMPALLGVRAAILVLSAFFPATLQVCLGANW